MGSGTVIEEAHRTIDYYNSSFVKGQRQVASATNKTFGTVGDNGSTAKRMTTSTVFNTADFGSEIKVFIPAGFYMAVRQATALDDKNAGYIDGGVNPSYGGAEGAEATFSLDSDYAYWTFWVKYGDGTSNVTQQNLDDLNDDFYFIEEVERDVATPVIRVIGTEGTAVKEIYNNTDPSAVDIYSKAAVDALLAGAGSEGKLRVFQYNIGHFNMGRQPASVNIIGNNEFSSYDNTDYDTQLALWTAKIQGIGADIICMPEYSSNFGWSNGSRVATANTGIFSGYNLSVGKSVADSYWINAIATKTGMTITNAEDIDLGSLSGASAAYVRVATATINGKTVKIGVTHLNWSKNTNNINSRTKEIKQLIKLFKDDEYVILCGDFNTDGLYQYGASKTEDQFMSGVNEFNPFIDGFYEDVEGTRTYFKGGYSLANHGMCGDIKTCDATGSRPDHLTDANYGNNDPDTFYNRPFCCLDNIITKGFFMSNTVVIDDGRLTDHCGLVVELKMM